MRSPYVRKRTSHPVERYVAPWFHKLLFFLRHIWNDLSTWVLVGTNVVTITAAYTQHWSWSTIIWVYWCQTLIIGFFAFLRTVSITDYAPIRVDWLRFRLEGGGRLRSGFFFLSHFTIVQAGLTFILWMLIGPLTAVNGVVLLSSALLFFGNHLFSYVYHLRSEPMLRKNIGLAVFRPYLRLLPVLVSLLFAGIILAAFYLVRDQQLVPIAFLVLFVLKTGADVTAHTFEHGVPQAKKKKAFQDANPAAVFHL